MCHLVIAITKAKELLPVSGWPGRGRGRGRANPLGQHILRRMQEVPGCVGAASRLPFVDSNFICTNAPLDDVSDMAKTKATQPESCQLSKQTKLQLCVLVDH